MVRRSEDCKVIVPATGIGSVNIHELATGEEMYGKSRLFARVVVAPGSSLTLHAHNGESEFYHIIKGTALFNDNGTETVVNVGDTTITTDGESHSIANIGEEDLEFIALIPLK